MARPDGGIHIWDVGTGAELAVFRSHSVINAFAFSPDGKILPLPVRIRPFLTWDLSALVARPMPPVS